MIYLIHLTDEIKIAVILLIGIILNKMTMHVILLTLTLTFRWLHKFHALFNARNVKCEMTVEWMHLLSL